MPPCVMYSCAMQIWWNSDRISSRSSGSTRRTLAISRVSCSISSSRRCLKISAETSGPRETSRMAAFWRPVSGWYCETRAKRTSLRQMRSPVDIRSSFIDQPRAKQIDEFFRFSFGEMFQLPANHVFVLRPLDVEDRIRLRRLLLLQLFGLFLHPPAPDEQDGGDGGRPQHE